MVNYACVLSQSESGKHFEWMSNNNNNNNNNNYNYYYYYYCYYYYYDYYNIIVTFIFITIVIMSTMPVQSLRECCYPNRYKSKTIFVRSIKTEDIVQV